MLLLLVNVRVYDVFQVLLMKKQSKTKKHPREGGGGFGPS